MNSNDLTSGSILKKLFTFFIPVLLGMLFQQLYNTVDAIVVGRCVGHEALAAVGGSPAVIINLVIGFFTGLAAGATVVISQCFGARDQRRLSRSVHTVVTFYILVGLSLTLLGWFAAPWALRLIQTPEDIFSDSLRYLRIYFLGAAPLLLFNIGSGILRAVGDSRRPLAFLGVCFSLNIVLDLAFVAGLRMGVAGAALATALSQTVSALLVLIHLVRAGGEVRLRFRELGIDLTVLGHILYIGIPAGLQSAMYGLSNIIIQAFINGFGTVVVAAWTAIGKVDGVYWVTSNSFGVAICTFVGQCFGAGKYDRMKQGTRQWLIAALIASFALSAALLSLGRWLLGFFTDNGDVIEEAVRMLWYFVPFYPVWSFIEIISNTLRGAGDAIPPTVISLVGVCLLRILWLLLVVPVWNSVMGISMSYPFTWTVTALAYIIYYLRSGWLARCTGETRRRPA